jgi:catechol 2,3-dioxygenase-like lactoylglutathione lyase family enzyme
LKTPSSDGVCAAGLFDQFSGFTVERMKMLDHVFLTVRNVERSVSFYAAALAPLGVTHLFDYDGSNGPPGHPDLKGFGANGRIFFWLREGMVDGSAIHVGFVANNRKQVDAAYAAAIAAGATNNGSPAVRAYYDPRYYAANVFDPDGYSLEFVYKSWQDARAQQSVVDR